MDLGGVLNRQCMWSQSFCELAQLNMAPLNCCSAHMPGSELKQTSIWHSAQHSIILTWSADPLEECKRPITGC